MRAAAFPRPTDDPHMTAPNLNWIANYIWGIADDVLRDVYVRGKYRDVILPMTVLRRLDAVLEPTKRAVLDMKATLDVAGVTNQDAALRQAAGQAFHNTSEFTLSDLRARAGRQQLRADFVDYLDGFSPSGSPEARIPAGSLLTTYRTARSAFPAVGSGPAPSCRDSRETGIDWREFLVGRHILLWAVVLRGHGSP